MKRVTLKTVHFHHLSNRDLSVHLEAPQLGATCESWNVAKQLEVSAVAALTDVCNWVPQKRLRAAKKLKQLAS